MNIFRKLYNWITNNQQPATETKYYNASMEETEMGNFGRTLTIEIDNTSPEDKDVHLFSLLHNIPNGVKVNLRESSYDFLMKTITSVCYFSTKAMVYSSSGIKNLFYDCYGILQRSTTGSSAELKIPYIEHYNTYNLNDKSIDLNGNPVVIDGLNEFVVKSKTCTKVTYTFFIDEIGSRSDIYAARARYQQEQANKPRENDNLVTLVIENTTNEVRDVKIFDVDTADHQCERTPYSGINYDGVVINTMTGGYLHDLQSMRAAYINGYHYNAKDYTWNTVKVYCDDHIKLSSISLNKSGVDYQCKLNINHYQVDVMSVDIDSLTIIDDDGNIDGFSIKLPANTKIILMLSNNEKINGIEKFKNKYNVVTEEN